LPAREFGKTSTWMALVLVLATRLIGQDERIFVCRRRG
jgi:hypothetical protein